MNKKNITPNPTQPVNRIPTGQLSSALAELSEVTLTGSNILAAGNNCGIYVCAYEGDDAE